MKKLRFIMYAEAYAGLAKWVLGFTAFIMFGIEIILNINYFDTHCEECGMYPEGLFVRMVLIPLVILALAFGARFIQKFLHKYYIYVKKNGRR